MEHTPIPLDVITFNHTHPRRKSIVQTWLRMNSPCRRIGYLFGIAYWPLLALYSSFKETSDHIPQIRTHSQRSFAWHLLRNYIIAIVYGRSPRYYYLYKLYERPINESSEYVSHQEFKSFSLINTTVSDTVILRDKGKFEQHCLHNDLPCVQTLMKAEGGKVANVNFSGTLHQDVFIKSATGQGGAGAQVWYLHPGNIYLSNNSAPCSPSELIDRILLLSNSEPLLVQPHITNHNTISERFPGLNLCTIRVLSTSRWDGTKDIVNAVLKLPRSGSITDNIGGGAIGCAVEMTSGTLLYGNTNRSTDPIRIHPDTGTVIVGFTIPYWNAVVSLALKAHGTLPNTAIIGWDIAVTNQGPVLLEGNSFPTVDFLQQLYGPLFRNSAFRATWS